MKSTDYQPDTPRDPTDLMIAAGSGPEPVFDPVMTDFLFEGYFALKRQCARGGLLEFASLGITTPWLYRLSFSTRGLVRADDGEIVTIDRHVVACRFLPDHLRHADRFAMLRLVEPASGLHHPNVSVEGAVCVQVPAGATITQISQSLHDLFRWRLRQYDERDALNPDACAWGRLNVGEPIDHRPLFGTRLQLDWQDVSADGKEAINE